jgi:hypothetical protein
MERLLGTPPAQPPPDVPDLNDAVPGSKPTTVREKTEIHRRNPACASCHAVMDPLGFALENFDTVGGFHTVDQQTRQPIDTAAVMPDGTRLSGPADLHQALASRPEMLAQTITEKLMVYAVGRHLDYRDMPTVRRIVRQARADNYRFESIVLGVVNSDAFRRREPAVHEPVNKTAQVAARTAEVPAARVATAQ